MSETAKPLPAVAPWIADRPLESGTHAQEILDALWARVVNGMGAVNVRFLSRDEVGERMKLVDSSRYGVDLRLPVTHGSLAHAIWPALGQAIAVDAANGARERAALVRHPLRVTRFNRQGLVAEVRVFWFEDASPLILPEGVAR